MSLMPYFTQQFFDDNGDPLVGGKVYFYEPGTSTLKTVYSDSNGNTALSNPVVLDSAGRTQIFLDGYYKVVMKDANDTLLDTIDNVSAQFYQVTSSNQWVSQTASNLTFASANQFTLSGDETANYAQGRRITANVTAGTLYGTVANSVANGSPSTTTVTVILDSGNLDSGLSSVGLGIITEANNALPMFITQDKAANYTLTNTDGGRTIILGANAVDLTMGNANAFPDGFDFKLFNSGANQATAVGTINGFANVTFLQYESAHIFGDGANWFAFNLHNQEPVGSVKWWHKSANGTPQTLPWGWVEADGTVLSDAESPINGITLPAINTDGRFIRGSNTSGTEQANQNLSHAHTNSVSGNGANDVNVHRTANFSNFENLMIYDLDGSSGSYAYPAAGTRGSLMDVRSTADNLMANSSNIASLLSVSIDANGEAEARPDNISMVAIIKIK